MTPPARFKNDAFARFWRIPFRYAPWLVVPLLAIMVWGARRDGAGKDATEATALASDLESVHLRIDRDDLGKLDRALAASGDAKSCSARLTVGGRSQRVKVRRLGEGAWQIKTKSGNPIRDRRTFVLRAPPTIGGCEAEIANQLACEIGLISPDVHPVKMFVNGDDAGLHLWWDVADESLLRRFRRMPGSIYSGDGESLDDGDARALFADEEYWQKVAARNSERAADRTDIQMLIAAVNSADAKQFKGFADEHLDLLQFARFTALDRLLGGQNHDYVGNHRLYFDPYKGKFEPIEWNFGAWRLQQRAAGLDQACNPLLMRLRQHPEYELAIQRQLVSLLSRVTPQWLEQEIAQVQGRIEHELVADASNSYADRHAWLQRRLRESELACHLQPAPEGSDCAVLSLQSDGLVGQVFKRLTVAVAGASSVTLLEDRNRNSRCDDGDRVIGQAATDNGAATFELDEQLLPGCRRLLRRHGQVAKLGRDDLVPAPLDYRYLIRANDGAVTSVALAAENILLGEPVEVVALEKWHAADDAWSCHPWDLPASPAKQTIELGPGVVTVAVDRHFGPETTVVIHPGTEMLLGKGVSVEFEGKVVAQGTQSAPIRIGPLLANEPWGVFALHGQGTNGSRFTHCEWRDGSTADLRAVVRTGMVSIIDMQGLVMANCFIGRNHIGDDALHWGYLRNAEIRDSEFRRARSDAFDVDISTEVVIQRCRFRMSGNDSIDLMTSHATVLECVFEDAGDKGVSVGEGTELDLRASQFSRCFLGIEIKDGSVAKVDGRTCFHDCRTGVNLYRKNKRYSEGGTVIARQLHIVGALDNVVQDKRSTVDVQRVVTVPR